MRRPDGPPLKSVRYRDRPGAYGILLRDGMILLAEQNGALLLPGGGIDPGETPLRALHREVYEETGWRIAAPRRVDCFVRYVWLVEEKYHGRKIQHVYAARPVRPLGPPVEHDHIPVWARAAHAPDMLSVAGEADVLERALRAGLRG